MLLAALVDELADREEELGALRQRKRAPGRERRLGGLHGLVDLLDARKRDGAGLLARRGDEDGSAAARLTGHSAPAIQ